MNYLDLINKCLVELNYKKVYVFDELTKNDHLKIKNILNIINAEVCGHDSWGFLLRKVELTLPAGSAELTNTVNGRIKTLLIGNTKYEFTDDFEKFVLNAQEANTYSAFNDKLLFPIFDEDKTIEVYYYTNAYATNSLGEGKPSMILSDDETVIPAPYAEPLLVYGTCMRLKANPEYSKFSYWLGMYKDALATMRSKIGTSSNETPSISLKRR